MYWLSVVGRPGGVRYVYQVIARNASADAEVDGTVVAKQAVCTPGVCEVPQISSDQHNYNPPGLGNAATLALNAAVPVKITGLRFSGTEGRWLLLVNMGNVPVTLVDDSTKSESQNTFRTGTGSDFVLRPNQTVQVVHVLGRWRFPVAVR